MDFRKDILNVDVAKGTICSLSLFLKPCEQESSLPIFRANATAESKSEQALQTLGSAKQHRETPANEHHSAARKPWTSPASHIPHATRHSRSSYQKGEQTGWPRLCLKERRRQAARWRLPNTRLGLWACASGRAARCLRVSQPASAELPRTRLWRPACPGTQLLSCFGEGFGFCFLLFGMLASDVQGSGRKFPVELRGILFRAHVYIALKLQSGSGVKTQMQNAKESALISKTRFCRKCAEHEGKGCLR